MKNNNKTTRGFTLIELLVVIAIIGILASLVLVALGNARREARDASIRSSVQQMRIVAEARHAANNSYTSLMNDSDSIARDYQTLVSAIEEAGGSMRIGGQTQYRATTTQWCQAVTLNSGNSFCLDSKGGGGNGLKCNQGADNPPYECAP